jgi:NADH-quinone oxidoreductase subunit J
MEMLMFSVTAAVALIGAVAMLVTRNAVHSALFLLLNFLAIAILFLMLQSPFLFAIQLTVYAGAIMVLFLFVVMLLGAERVEDKPDRLGWQLWLALVLGAVLFIQAFMINAWLPPTVENAEVSDAAVAAINSPTSIGEALFTRYLLPFEITGVLLLVAIIGVVVLQQRSRTQAPQKGLETAFAPPQPGGAPSEQAASEG